MPLISVIMSVYNETANELNLSINSILNQTYDNFELIIVDDNSSSKWLKKFLINKSQHNNRIRLLFNSFNMGAALSRNKGIKVSRGKLIAIMDADDISIKDRLYNQLTFLNKHRLDFVFSNCKPFNSNKIGNKIVNFHSNIFNQELLKYLFSNYYDFAVHSGWLVKREIYEKLCGYRHLTDGEDFDFIIRALTCGYKLGYQSKVLVLKRRRKSGVSYNNNLRQFTISLILKRYAKKYNYNRLIPFNKVYDYQRDINKRSQIKFNKFLILGHNVKYNLDVSNLIRFISVVCTSWYSIEYLIDIVRKKEIHKRVVRMLR